MKRYLLYTFAISWAILIAVCLNYVKLGPQMASIMIMAVMFIPLIGALLSGHSLKGMGWKPSFKGKGRYWLMAWFLPGIISVLGALLFFAVFPKAFDMSGAAMAAEAGEDALRQLEAAGMTYKTYILLGIVQSLTINPIINAIPAIGEEAGWRGVMTPYFKEKYGRKLGLIISGIIWGIWHWPLMILIGYEYGSAYYGAPFLGPLVFCLMTVCMGILMDYVYDKGKSIWLPAVLHGSINSWGSLPMALMSPAFTGLTILGPAPVGLLAGLPLLICALLLLKKEGD